MSSTYSTNLAIELIGTGDQAGTWGTTTNSNLGTLIEQSISGYVTQAVSTGTDTTITIPNGSSGVARNMYIELTGTGGASTNLIVPANKKLYFIFNNSSGAVTVKVSGQTGVSVPTGKKMVLVSNGTDIVNGLNYIADFASNSATITHLSATSATITNLTLTSLVISNLSIASANITTLTSASATITNLLATTLTTSSTVTLNGGTANGVAFLNASKVVTSGTALTFSGTEVGIVNATPSIKFTDTDNSADSFIQGTDGNLRFFADDNQEAASSFISWAVDGSEQARLNTTGLGIGTTSPQAKLVVSNGGANGYELDPVNGFISAYNRSTSAWTKITTRASSYTFNLSNTNDALNIDSSGNLGLGVTPGTWTLSGAAAIQNKNAGWMGYLNNSYLTANATNAAGDWKYIATAVANLYAMESGAHKWYTAASGTAGNTIAFTQALTLDASGNLLVGTTTHQNYSGGTTEITLGTTASGATAGGAVTFSSGSGLLGYVAAQETDTTIGSAISVPLRFNTNNTERARITAAGDWIVGSTTIPDGTNTAMAWSTSGDTSLLVGGSGTGGNQQIGFINGNGAVGSITTTGSSTAYNTSSDVRLKKNIVDAQDSGADVDALQVRSFDWKSDNTHQRYGFIAQELVTVAPEAVHQPTDTEKMMGVDYSKLVPMLVKELQSLRKRVAELESK